MKKDKSMCDEIKYGKALEGGYVNHALSESGLDLTQTNGSHDAYKSHRDILGSSDFVCEYIESHFLRSDHINLPS